MADDIPPRFRKTKNDTWAVMAPTAALEKALAEGGKIEVQRKSGDWSTFTVASLGRPFDVDGVEMCYGYPADEEGDESTPAKAGSSGARPSKTGASKKPSRIAGPGKAAGQNSAGRTPVDYSTAPQPDPSEPLPEYQGDPGEEWDSGWN